MITLTETAPIVDTEPLKPDHTKSAQAKVREMPAPTAKPTTAKTAAPKVTKPKKGKFVEPLTRFYAMVGVGLMPFDSHCAAAVVEAAPNCAESLDNWANENDAVRRVLESLTETTAISGVIIAHAPIVVAVLSHHSPADLFKTIAASIRPTKKVEPEPPADENLAEPIPNPNDVYTVPESAVI